MTYLIWVITACVTATANSAANFNELNNRSRDLLAESGRAQRALSARLLEKMGTDWGLPPALIGDSVKTLAEANYTVEFPDDKACNPWPELLEGAKYRAVLEEQATEAVAFLGDYHARNLGENRAAFKVRHLKLCTGPHYWDAKRLEFDRFKGELKLTIGPSQLAFPDNGPLSRGNLVTLTADQLKSKWNEGEMWEAQTYLKDLVDKQKNPVRRYWPLLNPVSDFRVALREVIRHDGFKLAGLLRAWIRLDDLSLQTGLLTTARKLGEAHVARIQKLSGAAAISLGQKWADKLADAKAAEDMAIATVGGLLKKQQEKQKGEAAPRKPGARVTLESFQAIDVEFTTGDANAFQEHVVVPEAIDIKVSPSGVVTISPTDRVSVTVALEALTTHDAFEKATLASVLKQFTER